MRHVHSSAVADSETRRSSGRCQFASAAAVRVRAREEGKKLYGISGGLQMERGDTGGGRCKRDALRDGHERREAQSVAI